MFSKLVNEDDGPDGAMTIREASINGTLLLLAGHDSTVNTIAHCVLTVLRNPGTFELLRRRQDLVPGAVEEALRLESAVQFCPPGPRWPTSRSMGRSSRRVRGSSSCTAQPTAIRKNSPNPNKFDPERRNNEHLGWGSGIHTCFGGPLARLEVNLALETFLRRVENPRLVEDPPEYRRSNIFRGPRHLMVDYDRIRD